MKQFTADSVKSRYLRVSGNTLGRQFGFVLDITAIIVREVVTHLERASQAMFGHTSDTHLKAATATAWQALGHIAHSNALYHDIEHTANVVLAGQQILLGRQRLDGEVSPGVWLDFTVSLLCHDIGFVPGICRHDRPGLVSGAVDEPNVSVTVGSCDAVLMPVHVDRGKRYVREQYADHPLVNAERVCENIERTRFPVPEAHAYQATQDYPGLVRGADLIGQLSDLRYPWKLPALYYEFQENGMNAAAGYNAPADLLHAYPRFYHNSALPFIQPALHYLEQTEEGRRIAQSLQTNLELAGEPDRLWARSASRAPEPISAK